MARIGVQLYTVREESSKDFLGTIEKVAALGYEGVEFAGFYGIEAEELKAKLDACGLVAIASHTPPDALINDLESVITYNKIIGNNIIVCPYAKAEDEESLEKLKTQLTVVGKYLERVGMTLLYHNHDHEFKTVGGQTVLDRLLNETDGVMGSELDTFWAYKAGKDPVAYMEELGDKLQLVHLKDGNQERLLAIGEGEAPVDAVRAQAEKMGIPWVIVENDMPAPTGIEDIARSMAYLKAHSN